jgi:hypothetical protein
MAEGQLIERRRARAALEPERAYERTSLANREMHVET